MNAAFILRVLHIIHRVRHNYNYARKVIIVIRLLKNVFVDIRAIPLELGSKSHLALQHGLELRHCLSTPSSLPLRET